MTEIRKPAALFLTILLALSTVALSSSTNAQETTARVTNNEEIVVSVNDVYYDRGSDIAVTVTSTNLDPGTEYTIDWVVCNWNGYQCNNQYGSISGASGSESFIATSSGIHSETITFTDPGPEYEYLDGNGNWIYQEGISNNSLAFKAELNVQGVLLYSNESDPFVLGGEMSTSGSYINTISNILKTTDVEFDGRIAMDHENEQVLEYSLTCELFESGATTPADSITRSLTMSGTSYTFESDWFFYDSNTNTYNHLTPTATSGDHYVECSYIRDVDNNLMGTMTSNTFQVIDDTSNQDDATILVGVTMNLQEAWGTVTIDAMDLDAGQEYTLDWVVTDYSHPSLAPTSMMQNDHIWVAGNDGTYTYELELSLIHI